MTTHILTGNFATDKVASLDNEAHAIDPFVFLPQKNTALVNREAGKNLHAHSENAMDVLDSHKSKTATSTARIGTMQDVDDFTSLCVNSDTVMMSMFLTEGPQPLYCQFLLIFVKRSTVAIGLIGLPRIVEIRQASIGICIFSLRESSTYLRIF